MAPVIPAFHGGNWVILVMLLYSIRASKLLSLLRRVLQLFSFAHPVRKRTKGQLLTLTIFAIKLHFETWLVKSPGVHRKSKPEVASSYWWCNHCSVVCLKLRN